MQLGCVKATGANEFLALRLDVWQGLQGQRFLAYVRALRVFAADMLRFGSPAQFYSASQQSMFVMYRYTEDGVLVRWPESNCCNSYPTHI
jgi:hypothetical protein